MCPVEEKEKSLWKCKGTQATPTFIGNQNLVSRCFPHFIPKGKKFHFYKILIIRKQTKKLPKGNDH